MAGCYEGDIPIKLTCIKDLIYKGNIFKKGMEINTHMSILDYFTYDPGKNDPYININEYFICEILDNGDGWRC
jgi:hypothetical protein